MNLSNLEIRAEHSFHAGDRVKLKNQIGGTIPETTWVAGALGTVCHVGVKYVSVRPDDATKAITHFIIENEYIPLEVLELVGHIDLPLVKDLTPGTALVAEA